jgi:ribosomal protein S18 acetylase RimI-like enzyme
LHRLIRQATTADLAPLIELSHRTIRGSYRSFLGDEAVEAFLGSGSADRFIEENLGHCTVIVRNGAVVGYAVCRDNLIDLMMIDEAAHRQGLGTALLAHLEAMLSQRYGELRLDSFEKNDIANAFYLANGWLESDRHVDPASDVAKISFHKPAIQR